jgi:hypothetical protein
MNVTVRFSLQAVSPLRSFFSQLDKIYRFYLIIHNWMKNSRVRVPPPFIEKLLVQETLHGGFLSQHSDSNDGFRWHQFTKLLYCGNNAQYPRGSGVRRAVCCDVRLTVSLCCKKFCFLSAQRTQQMIVWFGASELLTVNTAGITFFQL